jgi:uncharacterized membrane protein YfcA
MSAIIEADSFIHIGNGKRSGIMPNIMSGGGFLGTKFTSKLPKNTLSIVFSFLLMIVAVYIMLKSLSAGA